jgi:hypothetical protein
LHLHSQSLDEFLSTLVLDDPRTCALLQRWSALSNSDYMLRLFAPRIWMLTGLYEMEDARSFRTVDRTTAAKAQLAADLMAFLGIPVGGCSGIERRDKVVQVGTWVGPKVWAAKYQCLDLTYSRVRKGQELPKLSLPIKMKSLMAAGHYMGAGDADEQDVVALKFSTDAEPVKEEPGNFESNYFEEFEEAEARYDEEI